MAFGIEVWRSDGKKQLSITGRQTRIHSTYSYYIPGTSPPTVITQSVPGMSNDGSWIILKSTMPVQVDLFEGYFQVTGAWGPPYQFGFDYSVIVTVLKI